MANPTFRVSSGLLDVKHKLNIGPAIWTYLWCLDRQTGTHGKVLGGKPVRLRDIGQPFDETERQVRRHLRRLEDTCYLKITQTPTGLSIQIREQKKFPGPGPREGKIVPPRTKLSPPERPDKNVRPTGQKCPVQYKTPEVDPEVDPLRRAEAATQKPDPGMGRERPEDHDVPEPKKRQAAGLRNVTALERLRADKEARRRGELAMGSQGPAVGWMDVAAAAVKPMAPPAAKTPHGLSGGSRGKLRDRLMELIRKHWPETPAKKIKEMVANCLDKDLMITVAELEKQRPQGAA